MILGKKQPVDVNPLYHFSIEYLQTIVKTLPFVWIDRDGGIERISLDEINQKWPLLTPIIRIVNWYNLSDNDDEGYRYRLKLGELSRTGPKVKRVKPDTRPFVVRKIGNVIKSAV